MLEVFSYLGRFAGPLTCVTGSDGCGWFGWFGWLFGSVACMTMAVCGANLAEKFFLLIRLLWVSANKIFAPLLGEKIRSVSGPETAISEHETCTMVLPMVRR